MVSTNLSTLIGLDGWPSLTQVLFSVCELNEPQFFISIYLLLLYLCEDGVLKSYQEALKSSITYQMNHILV